MTARPGGAAAPRLTVDGQHVPAAHLARLVDRTARRLTAAGAGPGRAAALASDHPLTAVVTALAADAAGAPLLLDGAAPARRIAAAAAVHATASGEPLVVARTRPLALPEETAAVFWTSGSSGDPKAVALPAGALAHQGRATAARMGITAQDRLLLPLPLRHAYGHSVLRVWRTTGAHLYAESGFHLRGTLTRLATDGITSLDGVPTMYRMLAAEAARDGESARLLAGLRIRGCGGDVLTPGLYDDFLAVTGAPLHDGYGLSEAGPNVALNAPGDLRPGTVGRLLDGVRARVAGPRREIEIASPGLMLGYLDPATGGLDRGAFTADGWLRTGDTGTVTADGWLTVGGRIKEILVVHGETVAPTVVEDAVRAAAGVVDAAVVGVRRGDRGDAVWAFVESSDADHAAVAGRVAEACRRHLPPHARPRTVRVLDALPRTGSGKHDRTRLRAWASATTAVAA
ncbi:long-chain acyl-CoA synthetase/malonyl-CoA/methylmalonyl-CoA synthetase [Streptomyces sp. 1222.5]|uniref:class I adenylate-forming enzyme family protein n=1 Tax=unclassified Streptomyces TaxID=2593676 RepID=UPI000896D0A9|nr:MULTISPECIES: fatty acid--CoA ligase family protein [unclassified Streptomyces]PKW00302.1 long-chain acyl-CoA synthetase/malonyl-CoA/methylmalonyl-CoA synthetase [Streptomyces sp. 5112.2]SED85180.1 long-chain acyl-CoA synthetase/malonyl-CoA/methylmalonyl-CoA synthetase [Streptomyces sp. 1222.5]SEE69020.1 long-chain acyl-CoA synthetase/malonyl-CoA/methylmalonyl-CoA synthetase [Streptomyces sp. 2231.1]